jgi:hypothetical protein
MSFSEPLRDLFCSRDTSGQYSRRFAQGSVVVGGAPDRAAGNINNCIFPPLLVLCRRQSVQVSPTKIFVARFRLLMILPTGPVRNTNNGISN